MEDKLYANRYPDFINSLFHEQCGFDAVCIPNKKPVSLSNRKVIQAGFNSEKKRAFQSCQIPFPVCSL